MDFSDVTSRPLVSLEHMIELTGEIANSDWSCSWTQSPYPWTVVKSSSGAAIAQTMGLGTLGSRARRKDHLLHHRSVECRTADQAPAAVIVTDTIFRITFYCEKTPPPSLTRRRRDNTVPGTVTKQRKLATRISRTRHRRNVTGAMLFYSAFSSVQVHTFTQRRPSLAYPAHQCYMLHSIVLFTYH